MRTTHILIGVCLAALCLTTLTLTVSADSAKDKVAKYNARVGQKYLEEKSKEEGVITLPSGVRYKVLEKGSGKKSPGPTDQVKVHYAGTLINGKEFDSSYSRGQPATFGVNGVIKGWTEILQLMVEGDKYEVYIPSDKAYGAAGSGKNIGPNSTLVFKVELIEILGGGGSGGPKRPPPKKKPPPKAPKKPETKKDEL